MKEKLSDFERAYIAGFIDGEGYFGLLNNRHAFPSPCLKIVNTNYEVMVWLQKRLGGSITSSKRKHGISVCHMLTLSSNFIRWVLPQIHDLLIVKKREAGIMEHALLINAQKNIPNAPRGSELRKLQKQLQDLHSGHANYFRPEATLTVIE